MSIERGVSSCELGKFKPEITLNKAVRRKTLVIIVGDLVDKWGGG